jgi:hypothetical protein
MLAEANAQTEAEAIRNETTDTPAEPIPAALVPTSVRKNPPRLVGRNNNILGLAWLNGSLHAATFHRQKMAHSWTCPTAVHNVGELELVLDDALAQLEFAGTEMFLVLENEVFVHQADDIPVFSDGILRNYLKNRIQRHEHEHGPVLWVMQPLIIIGQEQSLLLHLLPKSFYDELHRILIKRHLDLTRILPLVVPLQYELNRIPAGKNTTVIVVAETGTSTSVVAGRVNGPLLFSRTILADLKREPARVGVEVNRSLLYAKQHFENAVSSIWLMAENGVSAAAEIKAKCGVGKKIVVLPATPIDWLQSTAKVSPQQPINLLSRYLKAKLRNQFIRGGFLIAVWLGLALMVLNQFQGTNAWNAEKARLVGLHSREASLRTDRERLERRNQTIAKDHAFIERVTNDRLPPVPARLLGFVAGLLPESARLMEFNVKWDTESGVWSFQFSGTIETDDETARALVAGMQADLAKSALRARFNENARALVASPINAPGAAEIQRFNLEGVLLEK